jgi:asparagine synthase (glutamine-hydrolysing)
MSIIFGFLRERSHAVQDREMSCVAATTAAYATERGHTYIKRNLGMALQPYFSHERSRLEVGPIVGPQGSVITFDGRLDNYKELTSELGLNDTEVADSSIVLAAFDRWGKACFSRLIGDWALALWSEREQALYLARDHAGTRTLYFHHEGKAVIWSTHLDTFHAELPGLSLAEKYIARYLIGHPLQDMTPYKGVHAIPPAHCLIFRDGSVSRFVHWDSTVHSSVRYRSDAEYEAHFFALFQQAVERRTGEGAPILAQLSGGMDSTAIVCMSDHIRRSTNPNAPILDTVSFYDDSESSWNEKPYFSATESRRGKVGKHFNTAFSLRTFEPHDPANGLYLLPGADSFSFQQESTLHDFLLQRGFKSILSGIGGDEVLGGVPTAYPELSGYLASGEIGQLLRRAMDWSLVDRDPIILTLFKTVSYTTELYWKAGLPEVAAPPWISAALKRRIKDIDLQDAMLPSLPFRIGVAPHRLDNRRAWLSILESLPHLMPQILSRPEYRYPFLDKDLVNFLFSIPREQLVRPGRRRSLMRRALVGIVPPEILERPRKAFQIAAPLKAIRHAHAKLERVFQESVLADLGLIDAQALRTSLRATADGRTEWWQALLKTIATELWLQSLLKGDVEFLRSKSPAIHQSLTA